SGDTCAAGSSCCVALAGFSLAGTCTESAEGSCESGAYPIGCDGKEDCTGEGEVCCLAGIEQALGFDLSKLRGSCIAATECVDVTTAGEEESRQQACVESSECPNDEVCCGVSGGFISLPIDVGVCASACEL
ncbi:MAG: hypothetical protein ACO3JL_14045, partial [Myxococcota bacterium]